MQCNIHIFLLLNQRRKYFNYSDICDIPIVWQIRSWRLHEGTSLIWIRHDEIQDYSISAKRLSMGICTHNATSTCVGWLISLTWGTIANIINNFSWNNNWHNLWISMDEMDYQAWHCGPAEWITTLSSYDNIAPYPWIPWQWLPLYWTAVLLVCDDTVPYPQYINTTKRWGGSQDNWTH